jgi:hypothetical protein
LEHQISGPGQWLPFVDQDKNNDDDDDWERFGPHIFPLVMEKPYTLEEQIDAAVQWFFAEQAFEGKHKFGLRNHWVRLKDQTSNCTYGDKKASNTTTTTTATNNNNNNNGNGNGNLTAAAEKAIVDALEKKNPFLPNPNDRHRRLATQTQQGQRPAVSKNKQNRKHQNKGRPKKTMATNARGENNGNQCKKGIITLNQQPKKYCNPLPRKT